MSTALYTADPATRTFAPLATQILQVQMGFFNPQMTDQALACLDMMDFDGKDGVMQKIQLNGVLAQRLQQYQQLALSLAQIARPDMVQGIAADMGIAMPAQAGA